MKVWINDWNGNQLVIDVEEGYHPEVMADLRRHAVEGYLEVLNGQIQLGAIEGSGAALLHEEHDALPPDPTTA